MKEFKDTIEDVISGKYPRYEIVKASRKTPDIIQALGFNDLPIAITQKHIISITAELDGTDAHKHGVYKDIIANIYDSLANPAIVLLAYKNQDRIIVVTDKIDKNKNPIVVIMQRNGIGQFDKKEIKCNVINSIYGRENFESFLQNAIVHNELMYYDNEKSHSLLANAKKSYPGSLASYDSNIIIRQLNKKVNTLLQNNFVNNDEKNNELRLASEKLIELGSSEAVAKTDAALLIPIAKDNLAKLETKEPITQKENTISKQLTNLPAANKNKQ